MQPPKLRHKTTNKTLQLYTQFPFNHQHFTNTEMQPRSCYALYSIPPPTQKCKSQSTWLSFSSTKAKFTFLRSLKLIKKVLVGISSLSNVHHVLGVCWQILWKFWWKSGNPGIVEGWLAPDTSPSPSQKKCDIKNWKGPNQPIFHHLFVLLQTCKNFHFLQRRRHWPQQINIVGLHRFASMWR